MSISSVLEFLLNHSYLLSNNSEKSYDNEFIKEINNIRPQLNEFLSYFSLKCSIKTENTIEKNNIKEFLLTLSQYLDLPEYLCQKLFEGYLLRDSKIDDHEIDEIISRGFKTKTLLQKIKSYYREERFSLIRIVRYCFIENHIEYAIIGKLILRITEYKTKEKLFEKLLDDYEKSMSNLSNKKLNKWDDEYDDTFITYTLNEEIELLQTILIGANSLKNYRTKDLFLKAFNIFKQINFGQDLPIKKYSVKKSQYKYHSEKICFLQSLILIDLADISSMFKDGNKNIDHFLNDSAIFLSLLNTIRRMGLRQCDSILMIFVSLISMNFSSHVDHSLNNQSLISSLAEDSLKKLNLLDYLQSIINKKPYLVTSDEGSYLGLAVYCVTFDLISLLCYNINLNSIEIQLKNQIVEILCSLLVPMIYHSTTEPLNVGFKKCLEDLATCFPYDMGLLKVSVCLMKQSEPDLTIIETILSFLDNLCWFCETDNRSVKFQDSPGSESPRVCSLENSCSLIKNVQLAAGHCGYMLQNRCIVWPVKYSVWDVIEHEIIVSSNKIRELLDRDISTEMFDSTNITMDRQWNIDIWELAQKLEPVLDFLIVAIKNKEEVDKVYDLLKIIYPVIDHPSLNCEAFLSCIEKIISLSTSCLIETEDLDVIHMILEPQYLFPHTLSESNNIFSNESVITRIWRPSASPTALKVINAYLQFCMELIQLKKNSTNDIDVVPTPLLHGCIFFVIDQLLANVLQSGITDITDVTELAINSFVVLSEVLNINLRLYKSSSSSDSTSTQHLSLLQQLIINRLCQNNPESLRTILYFSSIGLDVLLKQSESIGYMLTLSGTEERVAYATRIALSLIDLVCTFNNNDVYNQQLMDMNENEILNENNTNIGALAISKILQSKNAGNTSLTSNYISQLISYLAYPYNVKLARMSMLLMRHMIEQGCITTKLINDAFSLNQNHQNERLLAQCLVSNKNYDQMLCCLVIELLSSCLMNQNDNGACVLRILSVIEINIDNDAVKMKKMSANNNHESRFSNWVKSAIDILDTDFDIDDEISVSVMRSFSKLLLSLWLRDFTGPIDALIKENVWFMIDKISDKVLNHLIESEEVDVRFIEILSNLTGVVAMEFFASSSSTQSLSLEKKSPLKKSLTNLSINRLVIDMVSNSNYLFEILKLFERRSLVRHGCIQDSDYPIQQIVLKHDFLNQINKLIFWWRTLLGFVLNYDVLVTKNDSMINCNVWSLSSDQEAALLLKILASGTVMLTVTPGSFVDKIINQFCEAVLVIVKTRYKEMNKDNGLALIRAICEVLANPEGQQSPNEQFYSNQSSRVIQKRFSHLFVALSMLVEQFRIEDDEITQESVSKIINAYLQVLSVTDDQMLHEKRSKIRDEMLLQVLNTAIILTPSSKLPISKNTCYSLISLLNDQLTKLLQTPLQITHGKLQVVLMVTRYVTHIHDDSSLLWTSILKLIPNYYSWSDYEYNSLQLQHYQILVPLVTILLSLATNSMATSQVYITFLKSHWSLISWIINEKLLNKLIQQNNYHNLLTNKLLFEDLIELSTKFFDFFWLKLIPLKNIWSLYLPNDLITDLWNLVHKTIFILTIVIGEKCTDLFPSQTTFLSRRSNISHGRHSYVGGAINRHSNTKASPNQPKQVTFSEQKSLSSSPLPTTTTTNKQHEPSTSRSNNDPGFYVRLEMGLYRLFSSCIHVYICGTALNATMSLDMFYGETNNFKDNGTDSLLRNNIVDLSFVDPIRQINQTDKTHENLRPYSISFGVLFSFLNSTVHLTRDGPPLQFTDPLTKCTIVIPMESVNMMEIHEQVSSIIVTTSLHYLMGTFPNILISANQRAEFLLNLKSELQSYLTSLSKTRRQHRHSSNLSTSITTTTTATNNVTSIITSQMTNQPSGTTPPHISISSVVRQNSISTMEIFGSFFVGLDQFKKSLENF